MIQLQIKYCYIVHQATASPISEGYIANNSRDRHSICQTILHRQCSSPTISGCQYPTLGGSYYLPLKSENTLQMIYLHQSPISCDMISTWQSPPITLLSPAKAFLRGCLMIVLRSPHMSVKSPSIKAAHNSPKRGNCNRNS